MQSKVDCKQKAKHKQRLDPSVHLFSLFFYTYFMSRLAELRGHKCNQRAQFPHDKVVTKCSATPSEAYRYDRTHNFDNALQNFVLFLLRFILAQFVHVHPGFVVSPKELGTQIGATAVQQLGHWVGPPTKRGNDMAEMFFFAIFISPMSAADYTQWTLRSGYSNLVPVPAMFMSMVDVDFVSCRCGTVIANSIERKTKECNTKS